MGYEKIILLYSPTTYETADVISTYVYRTGLLSQQYSYAGAVEMCIRDRLLSDVLYWLSE